MRVRAEGRKAATIQEAEGRAEAVRQVYAAIMQSNPTPELLAVLQLDTLSRLVESNNAKLVVPYEAAGILGASQALKSVLDQVGGTLAGATGRGGSSTSPPERGRLGRDEPMRPAGRG